MRLPWAQARAIVRNDQRILWRSWFGPFNAMLSGGAAVFGIMVLLHFMGTAICAFLRHPPSLTAEAAGWAMVTLIMLGASMNAAIAMLYERSDFDFLLAAPVSGRTVLFARMIAIVAAGFFMVSPFLPPLLDPALFFFGPRYLAGYLVWAALAVLAGAGGTGLALLLASVLGGRRARTVSQVLAAVIGGSFYLIGQLPSMLRSLERSGWGRNLAQWIDRLPRPRFLLVPARAGRGDVDALLALILVALAATVVVILIFHRVFVAGLQDIAQAPATRARKGRHRWTSGLLPATFWKDVRLIVRDPLLLAQILPQMVYLVPVLLSAGRWLGLGTLAPLSFMICWQLSASLSAVATAGEECWDLIRMSPSPEVRLRAAKLAAGMALPAMLLVLGVVVLAVLGRPGLALLTLGIALVCSAASSWLAVARVELKERREILRRGGFRSRSRGARGGHWALQLCASFYFLLTGAGGLACAAWGRYPVVAAVMLIFALAGAAACFVFVKFEEIVWREQIA